MELLKKILLILACFALVGCITQERCNRKYPPQENTVETIIIRDTVIKFRIKEVYLSDTIILTTLEPVNIDKSMLISEFCFGQAWVQDSKLFHTLRQNEVEKEIVIKEAIKYVDRVVTKVVEKRINYLTWWQQTRLKIFNVLLIGGGLYFAFAKRKVIFSLIKRLI